MFKNLETVGYQVRPAECQLWPSDDDDDVDDDEDDDDVDDDVDDEDVDDDVDDDGDWQVDATGHQH